MKCFLHVRWGCGRRNRSRRCARKGLNAPDGVASSEANPLRHRAVLLLRLGKLLLGSERLVAL